MKKLSPAEKKFAENVRRVWQEKRFEKKRAWNEKRYAVFSLMALGIVFTGLAVFNIIFPRSTVSEIENRTLNAFPSFSREAYFSGSYTSDITAWYDDTVPFRDSFKNMGNTVKTLFGFTTEDTVIFINRDVVAQDMNAATAIATPEPTFVPVTAADTAADDTAPTATPEPTPSPTPEPQKDYRTEDAEFDVSSNSLMLVYQDGHWRCMPMFGGSYSNAVSYANALNALHEKLGGGVTIYSMPAPLSSQFYTPANAQSYTSDQGECFDTIAAKLDEGIVSINLCPVLQQHTEEGIYLRTDHHWAPLGAYYAAQTFADAAGVDFADLSTFTQDVNEGYVGTMYAFTGDTRLLYDPEDFIYYRPSNDYNTYYYDTYFNYQFEDSLFWDTSVDNSYVMFMGGDDKIVKITTDVRNGRRLLVCKDSYGNAEIPFYVGSFEEIYVTDMRYFSINLANFILDRGVTDVLFTMCSYSLVGTNADSMMNLVTQSADGHVSDGQLPPEPTAPPAPLDDDGQLQNEFRN